MTAYYNEIEPFAAAWLRQLISAGHIAPGDVDTRSIVDVRPDDLRGYTQCHFFAGIGIWSYALRRAGWPDSRPVWTGSCPCQPFSAAGKGGGFDDERHLWPHFHYLIEQCRPAVVIGEQVASKDGLGWLDLVQADMEGTGYAFGAVDTCAAGFGAPHIRQRLYWVGERLDHAAGARHVGALDRPEGEARDEARLRLSGAGSGPDGLADAAEPGRQSWGRSGDAGDGRGAARFEPGRLRDAGSLAHTRSQGLEGQDARALGYERSAAERGFRACGLADAHDHQSRAERDGRSAQGEGLRSEPGRRGELGGMEHASSFGRERREETASGYDDDRPTPVGPQGQHGVGEPSTYRLCEDGAGPTNGFWRDADWLHCRDGKWRPVEPGTFPLAHGAPARVGRLRGYGNAINAEQAIGFIEAYLETEADRHIRLTAVSEMTNDNEGIFG